MSRLLRAMTLLVLVAGCGSGNFSAPSNMDDACAIVAERPVYLRAMQRSERRWGVPVPVQMATIYYESKFVGNARTPHQFVLGVIPMGRMSSVPEQVEVYERHRMTVKDLIQAELFITNEQSAVQWLRQLLKKKPRTYAEIQPLFFSELQAGLPEWEALPELRDLLEESFLQDDQDRWYVPDPKKAEDLEKLRTKALLREFETYRTGRGKLDRFRSEAVRAGFKDAWARRDFQTILAVGKRLPDDAFVEDEALLYYHDNARRLAGS